MARVLIVDDDEMMGRVLGKMLGRLGHESDCAGTFAQGRKLLAEDCYDLVLLDVNLPDGCGIDLLPEISGRGCLAPETIIITAQGDPDGAELAIRNGAWDYIEKPASLDRMRLPIMRAIQYHEERKTKKPLMAVKRDGIIGNSAPMSACIDLLAQAAASEGPVLITGETGTGKELFAWAIHENSSRAQNNFVVVDCAALPENLVESALFGYKRGAFTGAEKDMDGLIKQADGGTLFLDEVGELPLMLQKAFLRVLQEHRFRPVGARQEVSSNFRVVAATNRNLARMVESGKFRKDLLFRLRSIDLEIPPLRMRSVDIRDIALHYVYKLCERYGVESKGFSPDFFDVLCTYDWPGNVRELVNTLEWALSCARNDPTLFPRHLPPQIRVKLAQASLAQNSRNNSSPDVPPPPEGALPSLQEYRTNIIGRAEKQYLQRLLPLAEGDIKKACSLSGLSRTRFYAVLKEHGLSLQK